MATAGHDDLLFPRHVPTPRRDLTSRLRPALHRLRAALRQAWAWGMEPAKPSPWALYMSMLPMPAAPWFLAAAPACFSGSAWTASPRIGFAYMAAAILLPFWGIAMAAWQWLLRMRFARTKTVAWASLAAGLFWTGYFVPLLDMLVDYVPYGYDVLRDVRDEEARPGIEVSPDGTRVIMRMGFETGVTDRIKSLLRGRPGIRTVELSGPGGIAKEGYRLARLIRERGLDTLVQRRCASACATAALAGRTRIVLAHAGEGYIGFHPPHYWDGNTPVVGDTSAQDEVFRLSGADAAFAWRVTRTSPMTLWIPTPVEFSAAGVPIRLADPYEVPGNLWGLWKPSAEQSLKHLDPTGQIVGVLRDRETGVLAAVLAWGEQARDSARNERMVTDRLDEAVGRVLALRLSRAGDAEVRKAGEYVAAAMAVTRIRSGGDCARLGVRPNLLVAARTLPGPPGAASDPDAPYTALLERAYRGERFTGWPEGIALPDVSSPATWSVGRLPRPTETCASLSAWYGRMTDLDNPDGVAALRDRFAAFARTPIVTAPSPAMSAALR